MDSVPSIRPLPPDTIAQIKSSINITSLNFVVIELLKNSLDARSNKIDINIEYDRGNCIIEDDGLGIQPAEFMESGGLGKLYHSSKYNSSVATHGIRGSFLASVAALSLVSITSRHHLFRSQNTLIINRSQVIARYNPATPQQHIFDHRHGTRVTVRDLFGNMPVRIKQRIAESNSLSSHGREWEELRKLITNVVLAWPSHVFIVARDGASDRKIQFRGSKLAGSLGNLESEATLVTHVCNTLSQAAFISSPDQSNWVPISASTPRIRMRGAISREPAPTKAVQFISLGISPLNVQYGHSLLFDEINRLFANSSFGNEDDSTIIDISERTKRSEDERYKGEGFTIKQLRGSRKGFDRWPMFFVKVELQGAVSHNIALSTEDLADDKKGSLSYVMELLQAMVQEFLTSHHFRPPSTRLVSFSQKNELKRTNGSPRGGDRPTRGTKPGRDSLKSSQLQRLDSPFDTWSRVKSGKPNLANSTPEQLYQSGKLGYQRHDQENAFSANINKPRVSTSPISGSGTAPGLFDSNLQMGEVHGQRKANSTLKSHIIARSGKVICPPFNTLQLAPSSAKCTHAFTGNETSAVELNCKDSEDKLLNWLNPLTRKDSLVNSRTGLVSQSTKLERLTPRILSSLGPDEVCNQSASSIPARMTPMVNLKLSDSSSTWVQDILCRWNNPIYCPTESAIPKFSLDVPRNESQQLLRGHQHSCSQLDIDRAFKEPSVGLACRISKEDLRRADIISQVDGKFILIKISANTSVHDDENLRFPINSLVIVDQHAADERCRIEDLLKELCKPPVINQQLNLEASVQPGVFTALLEKPISFIMPQCEIQLLQTHAQHFANWGIIFHLPYMRPKIEADQEQKVTVISLPPSIVERCTTVPRVLVELLRSESWKCFEKEPNLSANIALANGADPHTKHLWLRKIHSCPQSLLEILNSRACRSAIMFNDELPIEQCKALISRLAECAFPFQCAHGRPSMVPLLDLQSFAQESMSEAAEHFRGEAHFSAAIKRWKREMASTVRDG